MRHTIIKRRGSLLYTKAYTRVVVALTVVYMVVGVVLAVIGARMFDITIAGFIALAIIMALTAAIWTGYLAILWVFEREARQAVELGAEGVRETSSGRETAFIPWAGVKEIELAATVVAGASLRLKGNFSEISISNIDLVITEPMSKREMHKLLGQTSQLRILLEEVKTAAPHARFTVNKLARRRLGKQ